MSVTSIAQRVMVRGNPMAEARVSAHVTNIGTETHVRFTVSMERTSSLPSFKTVKVASAIQGMKELHVMYSFPAGAMMQSRHASGTVHASIQPVCVQVDGMVNFVSVSLKNQ